MKTFRQTQITNKQITFLVYNNNKILINNYKSQIPNQIIQTLQPSSLGPLVTPQLAEVWFLNHFLLSLSLSLSLSDYCACFDEFSKLLSILLL